MEIRKLEIDFDNSILKINGRSYTERPVVVTLPGPSGWPYQMMINKDHVTGKQEEYDNLSITFEESKNRL